MPDTVKIRIGSESDTRGVDAMERKIAELEGAVRKLQTSGKGLGETFGQGLGLGFGAQAFSALQQLPGFFADAVKDGVRFNATIESARLGVAAVLKQFDQSGKFATFQDAMKASASAIDELREAAVKSPATFEQLLGGFQGLSGAFASAGFSMKQSVDMVVLMSQALSGLGIRSEQLLQESRALVTGNITEDAMAARILGITKAQVDSARESGKLFDFLTEKLGAFKEAGEAGAGSLNVQLSALEDSLTQLKAVATEEFFTQFREGLKGINTQLGSENAKAWAAGVGNALSTLVAGLKAAADSPMAKLLTWNPLRDKLFGGFGAGQAADKAESLDAEKLSLRGGMNVTGEAAQAAAVLKLEEAIAARREEANKAEGEQYAMLQAHTRTLQAMLDHRERAFAIAKEQAGLHPEANKAAETQTKEMEKYAAAAERAGEALDKALDAHADKLSAPEDRLLRMADRLVGLREALNSDYARSGGAGGLEDMDFESVKRQIDRGGVNEADRATLIGQLQEIITLEEAITEEARKQSEAGGKELKSQEEKQTKREEILAELRDELAIQTELTAGHDQAAKILEIERALRKEIATIAKSDLAPADRDIATSLAQQTAELKKQEAITEALEKKTEARKKSEEMVDDADPEQNRRRSDRVKEKEKFLRKWDRSNEKSMREAGLTPDEIKAERDKAEEGFEEKQYERKRDPKTGRLIPRGYTDGSTHRSPFERAMGKTGDDAWSKLFPSGASSPPDPFSGVMSEAGRAHEGAMQRINEMPPMTPPPGLGLGDMMPEPSQTAGGGAGGSAGEGSAGSPTEAIKKAGAAGEEAGEGLTKAAKELQTALEGIASSAKEDLGAAKEAVDALGNTLETTLQALKQTLDSLEGRVSSLEN